MLSPGQREALEELHAIAEEGGLQLVSVVEPDEPGPLTVDVVLDCSDAVHAEGGIALRRRERLRLSIDPAFPFILPTVRTPHTRWAKQPHVQWGNQMCLYRSRATEWNPADGMFGYFKRLLLWLRRAAAGELDPVGEPIHPPVAYPKSNLAIIVRADAPRAEGTDSWTGLAVLVEQKPGLWELTAWLPLDGCVPAAMAARIPGRRVIVAPILVLPEPIGFEYPRYGVELFIAMIDQQVSTRLYVVALGLALKINALLYDSGTAPLLAVVGAPGRGVVGEQLATHLVAWQVDADAAPLLHAVIDVLGEDGDEQARQHADQVRDEARNWLLRAPLAWTRIYEMRAETTMRRDERTSTSWVRNRRVLVLGAGALGAPTAEHCVRAGASEVHVVDDATVHPGMLVRQPYLPSEIGQAKATVLVDRLAQIDPTGTTVVPHVRDASALVLDPEFVAGFDLVIDATADRTVRHMIEIAHREAPDRWPPLVTMMIGHEAARGIATVTPRGGSAAGVDLLRKVGLAARSTDRLSDVADDFYPRDAHELFTPEPGCSDVTFRGSAADVTALAGQLLTAATADLMQPGTAGRVTVVRMPSTGGRTDTLTVPADLVQRDVSDRFEVRLSPVALGQMRTEARRGARVRGPNIETGGLLFGQYDPAGGIVWVDAASGPPPDSLLSARYFEHGVAGVDAHRAAVRERSGNTADFVGFWHSHPYGEASPSPIDEHGMGTLVSRVPGCRRALMLIVGGDSSRWERWLLGGQPPAIYVRVLARRDQPPAPTVGAGWDARSTPIDAGVLWPGGYALHPMDPMDPLPTPGPA